MTQTWAGSVCEGGVAVALSIAVVEVLEGAIDADKCDGQEVTAEARVDLRKKI